MIKLNNSPKNFDYLDARVRVRARVSTRTKFQNAQNWLKFILHTFQAILSISKICARPRPRARLQCAQNVNNVKMPFFHLICNLETFLDNFHQFKIDFN